MVRQRGVVVRWFNVIVLAAWCAAGSQVRGADDYPLGPDSMEQPSVPKGTVTKGTWESHKVFPGTVRDYWVYVPAQYDAKKPA